MELHQNTYPGPIPRCNIGGHGGRKFSENLRRKFPQSVLQGSGCAVPCGGHRGVYNAVCGAEGTVLRPLPKLCQVSAVIMACPHQCAGLFVDFFFSLFPGESFRLFSAVDPPRTRPVPARGPSALREAALGCGRSPRCSAMVSVTISKHMDPSPTFVRNILCFPRDAPQKIHSQGGTRWVRLGKV